MIIFQYHEIFFRLTAPRCPGMAVGAVSLRKSHDIVILSFCNIVKGQAIYVHCTLLRSQLAYTAKQTGFPLVTYTLWCAVVALLWCVWVGIRKLENWESTKCRSGLFLRRLIEPICCCLVSSKTNNFPKLERVVFDGQQRYMHICK